MSEWSFNANIRAEAGSVVQDLEALIILLRSPQKNAQAITDCLGFDADLLPAVVLDLDASDGAVTLTGGVSGAVPLGFFEKLVDYIDTLSDGQFHARLFDSGSGGVESWGLDDLPDIEGKAITFVGDFQEELDELIELANSLGRYEAEVSSATEILVLGEDPDASSLEKANTLKIPCITEEDFWDIVDAIPG